MHIQRVVTLSTLPLRNGKRRKKDTFCNYVNAETDLFAQLDKNFWFTHVAPNPQKTQVDAAQPTKAKHTQAPRKRKCFALLVRRACHEKAWYTPIYLPPPKKKVTHPSCATHPYIICLPHTHVNSTKDKVTNPQPHTSLRSHLGRKKRTVRFFGGTGLCRLLLLYTANAQVWSACGLLL